MIFGLRAVFAVNWSRVPMADCRVGTTTPQLVRLRGHMGVRGWMGMVLSHYAAWVINGSMPHPILAVVIFLLKDFLNQRIHFRVVILQPHVLPSCPVLSATC